MAVTCWRQMAACGVVLGAVYLAIPAPAAASPLWIRQVGTRADDSARAVATDLAGDVYLAGFTQGSLGAANRGESDAWLVKIGIDGQLLWRRQVGTAAVDNALGVATDPAGDIYIAGTTQGSLAGANRGDFDAWVAKYDAAGNELWRRQFGTVESDFATGVAADTLGDVYLTGNTSGALGGANPGGFEEAWVAKYDPAGHPLWKRQLGSQNFTQASGVAVDDRGDAYITGRTIGALAGPSHGDEDAWIAKYDAAGSLRWKRQLGTATEDVSNAVATDPGGNVYITGMTWGALVRPNPNGVADAWLAKFDKDGGLQWKRQFGTAEWDQAYGVATDGAGSVYVTGETLGSLGGASKGQRDAWLAKYSAAGTVQWTQQLGTKGNEIAYGVATDTASHVYITGTTGGWLAGPGHGLLDGWVAQYSAGD